jgi:hypothetical protein
VATQKVACGKTVMPDLEAGIRANSTGPVFAWMAGSEAGHDEKVVAIEESLA